MAQSVAQATATTPAIPATLPLKAIAPWAVFFGILMLVLLYFVGAEQGATSVFSGTDVHEWVHDARHLLGFPCH
ncbi:CbtB-domain containing protein [Streptomyces sp. NPDC005728]|uniref:CbtB domain-containing protein n=1 Tax=Streptomyces sp. NPDC005728 TaxID=3157054 RepID=UPI0033DA2C4D